MSLLRVVLFGLVLAEISAKLPLSAIAAVDGAARIRRPFERRSAAGRLDIGHPRSLSVCRPCQNAYGPNRPQTTTAAKTASTTLTAT